MHLVIFDVDGTLTRSTAVDTDCFARAIAGNLRVQIDTDWSKYRHSTDAGILSEILEQHGIPESSVLRAAVRRAFVRLLSESLVTDPDCCREVPGARQMANHLRQMPEVQFAIATGAWADSARLKLRKAGIPTAGLPFASSDDSPSREEILRIAVARAEARVRSHIDAVTYIGDAPWDVAAARSSGVRFVGVGTGDSARRLREAGAKTIFEDFTDLDAFLDGLLNAISSRFECVCDGRVTVESDVKSLHRALAGSCDNERPWTTREE